MEKIYQASTAEGAIDFINMFDLEEAAKEVIPKGGYGYISSGAGDIFTYQENEKAFNHKLIIPHVLRESPHMDWQMWQANELQPKVLPVLGPFIRLVPMPLVLWKKSVKLAEKMHHNGSSFI